MNRGFTLVELSIVLVIIGLVIGGVIFGSDMVRTYKLRAVIGEYEEFVSAANTFKLKYNAIPGDMDNAENVWGSATCPGTGDNPRTTTTCNGNGNGILGHNSGSAGNELTGLWQHLALAGLIPGQYTGVTTNTSNSYTTQVLPGLNVPSSAYDNTYWAVANIGGVNISSTSYPEGSYGNVLMLHAVNPSGTTSNDSSQPTLFPDDAYAIDVKIDDGFPLSGKMVTKEGNPAASYQCWRTSAGGLPSTSNTLPRATNGFVYYLQRGRTACPIYFKRVFEL